MSAEAVAVQKKGVVTKCPSCGAAVGAFASVCEACGHEFAEVDANRTIQALVTRFEQIEREVQQEGLGLSRRIDEVKRRRARVIRDFPIPNAREDLQQLIHYIHPKITESVAPDPNVEDWRAKFGEVMSRARAAYRNDATALAGFDGLEQSLNASMGESVRIKARRHPMLFVGAAGIALVAVAAAVNSYVEKEKLAKCEASYASRAASAKAGLERVVADAGQDLAGGRLTQAMARAQQVRWDKVADGCRVEDDRSAQAAWDQRREALMATIQRAADSAAAEKKAQADQAQATQQAAERKDAEIAQRAEQKQRAAAAAAATEQRKAATDKLF